jgi:UDP-N-acetylmuramoylalanine--D-glutamate ligase
VKKGLYENKMNEFFTDKTVLILGLGLEGKSTLKILENLPCKIIVADKNPEAVKNLPYKFYVGENYLDALYDRETDIIMKSPGISFKGLEIPDSVKRKITSQTDLLLRFRKNKIIGITGTKGKSTVSSLIYHILTSCGKNAVLIGNIGVPPLEFISLHESSSSRLDEGIDSAVTAVCEMSCHQLEFVQASPHIAVLLNIYEEHLDHYNSFADYRAAKENIYRYQREGDILIRGEDDDLHQYRALLDPKATKLRGGHNYNNIAVALKTAALFGCDKEQAVKAAQNFEGLPHRLESVGEINGVKFINDSISTIPKAAIFALEAFPDTDTIIIGGMDRGINYEELTNFLQKVDKNQNRGIINLIALPDSGFKVADTLETGSINIYRAQDMEEAVNYAVKVTKRCCILSPAAASYNTYKNFEERGEHFKALIKSIDK